MPNQYTINNGDTPLNIAIKKRSAAIRKKADPKVIARLEQRVAEEAGKVAEVLRRARPNATSVKEIVDDLMSKDKADPR